MRIQFLGSGDAFGSGGRFNTCFLVENKAGAFLIDCGASSLIAMRKYGIDPNCIDTVFISHLHGDHFGGLPFLILDAQFYSRRTTPLTVTAYLVEHACGAPPFALRFVCDGKVLAYTGDTEWTENLLAVGRGADR